MCESIGARWGRGLARSVGLLIAAATLAAPATVLSEDRAALVIGNQTYDNAPTARGARADARHIAEALREADYEVFEGYDLDSAELRDLLSRFERAARAGAATSGGLEGLAIYISAHAVRAGGLGYVAPVDLDPATLTAVALDGALLDLLLDIAALGPGRAVVMLDLSRPDGFQPTAIAEPGFADLDDPEGALVIAAAQPGRATNRRSSDDDPSPFAVSVVEEMLKPGAPANGAALSLAATMRESAQGWPDIWVAGDADEDFALVAAPPSAIGELRAQMELEAWKAAEESGGRRDYQQYLRFFPDGVFAGFARDRIAAIDAAESETADARRDEQVLRLSVRERARVQSRLTALGFDTGGVDGVFGPGTRGAIAAWQGDRGDQATGYLTEAQFAALRDDADERRRAADLDRRDWDQARNEDSLAAYEDYLAAHPDGLRVSEARERIAAIRRQSPQSRSAQEVEAALVLTGADRADVQRALTEKGYDTRGVDGALGPASRRAIALWQGDRGEPETGYLTEEQFNALSRSVPDRQPSPDMEEDAWRRAVDRDDEGGYREFLREYPDGRYAAEAERRIDGLRDRSGDVAAAKEEEKRQKLNKGQRRSIETRLAVLGLDPGTQDGKFTKKTRRAIAEFQRAKGILDSGYADRATVQTLVDMTPQVTQQELIGGAIGEIFKQFQ